jgi:excisionase family DNA binding protein
MADPWPDLTTVEAAKQLDVSRDAVIRYHHAGVLPGYRRGNQIMIKQRAVMSLQKIIQQARSGRRPQVRGGPHNRLVQASNEPAAAGDQTGQVGGLEGVGG